MNIIEISEKFPIHFENKTLKVLKSLENFHRNSVICMNREINLHCFPFVTFHSRFLLQCFAMRLNFPKFLNPIQVASSYSQYNTTKLNQHKQNNRKEKDRNKFVRSLKIFTFC
jgi:hypothetical protein